VRSRAVLTAAFLFDWIAGDPEWFPHPVRLIGKGVERGERWFRRPSQLPRAEFFAGGALTLGLVSATYLVTKKTIGWATRRGRVPGFVCETLLAWTCLASRSLHDESMAVITVLEAGDIVLAQQRLARIVGRDTQNLDANEISRAVIETVAESCSDGVIAPLFYLSIGGVPLAMAYKAINTLDSMIGHADERYFYFGKVAARLDDAANLLPSRLTAVGITVAASAFPDTHAKSALATWFHDGTKHKSPNAGHPESAMAGALQVRLGGENFYDGQPLTTTFLGEKFPRPSVRDAKQAIRLAAAVSILGAIAALLARRRG
jgi:adenosylcobinamide-phosphate synthase